MARRRLSESGRSELLLAVALLPLLVLALITVWLHWG